MLCALRKKRRRVLYEKTNALDAYTDICATFFRRIQNGSFCQKEKNGGFVTFFHMVLNAGMSTKHCV